ncbi:MAG: class I SAM-dependent methyltransferase [Anaerolineales bacterium]|nr:class I SAM-dependent methyltransferase [Anaerolineales bacterium]
MSDQTSEAIYDEIPYPNLCHNQTHPDRLAVIGRLLGMRPAPVTSCRVLELAAAKGGNLAPLAQALPGSEFVGLDYSAVQVAGGQALLAGAGLANARLLQRDILQDTRDLGEFDYIIAHGLYSWTTAPVRQRVLALCREQLAPQGIAFISFNALPGWSMLRTMREMMLFRTRGIESAGERSVVARQFVHQLAELLPDDQYFGFYVQHYAEELERRWPGGGVDPLLLHDEMEVENTQFYFHEFHAQLEAAGLQYLSDADFHKNLLQDFAPERARQIAALADGDFVALEQYMDIARNRTLRQALVVRPDVQIERRLQVSSEMMMQSHIALRGELVAAGAGAPAGAQALTGKSGARLATDHPVSLAAFAILLEQSPQTLPFMELLTAARAAANSQADLGTDAQVLAGNLVRGYTYDNEMVMLHSFAPPLTVTPGERPVASPVARWEAAQEYAVVANLRQERVRLEPLAALLLPLLDGQHDREALAAHLMGLIEKGDLQLKVRDRPVADMVALEVEQTVDWLARAGLIMREEAEA